jgi:hypothetical protein
VAQIGARNALPFASRGAFVLQSTPMSRCFFGFFFFFYFPRLLAEGNG